MKITKEDSELNTIEAIVNGNLSWVQITFKAQNRGSNELKKAKETSNSLIRLAALETGITLYDANNPFALTTKDVMSYRKLVDLLFKYNYLSPYDRKQIEHNVKDVERQLAETAALKETVASARRQKPQRRGQEIDSDLTGGYAGDIFDVLSQYTPKTTTSVIPNSFFATPPSPSAPMMQVNKDIPRHFLCPITNQIMSDPVYFISDEWTYEREAIESLLRKGEVSPVSQVGLEPGVALNTVLRPNWALKAAINDFKEQNPELFNRNSATMGI